MDGGGRWWQVMAGGGGKSERGGGLRKANHVGATEIRGRVGLPHEANAPRLALEFISGPLGRLSALLHPRPGSVAICDADTRLGMIGDAPGRLENRRGQQAPSPCRMPRHTRWTTRRHT